MPVKVVEHAAPIHAELADDVLSDAHLIRRLSVLAICDPRSVRSYLRGERIRPTTAARVKRALRQLGLVRSGL